ncbi:MAG TPA: UbiD family decarboxylase, partial [Candidatus Binatia bacterium]|nr:UbiD family decarboxylase [Candidatus Binatia bacterium]
MSTISTLAYKDLRGYIDAVEQLGELRVIHGADWDLELGAITEVAARATSPKVLLFDDIKGYPSGFRVLTNPVCSKTTTALAFGLEPKLTGLEIIRAWKEKLGGQKPLKPVEVSNGAITENVEKDVDLLKFPTPRWHEDDGGRYIGTGCMVIMRDPQENWINVGTYRVCVH